MRWNSASHKVRAVETNSRPHRACVVVERKTTIPICRIYWSEAKGSQLTITATDLELSIRTSCEAKIKKEGAGTIPAKKLLELVRLLPEGEIKVKLLENHWVEIVSDKKKYKLVGMAKENFPASAVMPHTLVKIPRPILENLIGKTKFAISMEESRYTLNGGLLILKPDNPGHGGYRRPPPGARGDRPQTCRAERRSESAYSEEGHGRSWETFQRRRF